MSVVGRRHRRWPPEYAGSTHDARLAAGGWMSSTPGRPLRVSWCYWSLHRRGRPGPSGGGAIVVVRHPADSPGGEAVLQENAQRAISSSPAVVSCSGPVATARSAVASRNPARQAPQSSAHGGLGHTIHRARSFAWSRHLRTAAEGQEPAIRHFCSAWRMPSAARPRRAVKACKLRLRSRCTPLHSTLS